MYENKTIFFMFWQKLGILISNFYLYSIKIQTTIDQNVVKNTRGNHKFFKNIFLNFFWASPALPSLVNKNKQWRTLHYSHTTWTVKQLGRGRILVICRSSLCRTICDNLVRGFSTFKLVLSFPQLKLDH